MVKQVTAAPPYDEYQCSGCGEYLEEGWKFCPMCGGEIKW